MRTVVLDITTGADRCTDVSAVVGVWLAEIGAGDGLVHLFAPHATVGLALIEMGAGSDDDLSTTLDRLLPRDDRWRHRHGSPGHGADHVVPALLCPSLVLPVLEGQLALGIWQSVVMVDTNRDNPRRHLRLSYLAG